MIASQKLNNNATKSDAIVFFDGFCGLCNRFVQILIEIDRKFSLKFAPLQGETARLLLPQSIDSNTVIFLKDDKIYTKSSAIISILTTVGGFGKLAVMGWLIPKVLRDKLYDFIAFNRYKIYGQTTFCKRPKLGSEQRFLA